jgi:hypothetical protein
MFVEILSILHGCGRRNIIPMITTHSTSTSLFGVSIVLTLLGSFLLCVHEKCSLAAAIAYHFEKQAQDVLEGQAVRPTPSRDGIRGFLQACEDQTSSFNWQNVLLAVGATLGISGKTMYVMPRITLFTQASHNSSP